MMSIRWPKDSIRRGELLYHGTQAVEKFDYPRAPAWFSDGKSAAEYFTTWNERGGKPRILIYRPRRAIPNLALIYNTEDLKHLYYALQGIPKREWQYQDEPPGDQYELADMVCDAGLRGWRIKANYSDGDDIVLCEGFEAELELVDVEYTTHRE